MSRFIARTLVALIAAMLLANVGAARDFFVSSSGSDANAGTEDSPFASIARAQDAIRSLTHPITENIRVTIGDGSYWLGRPLVFGPDDSGTSTSSVTYQAAPGASVLISGGRPITGWARHSGNIWKAQIPEASGGVRPFRYLWADGRRLTRARQPNDPAMWKVAEVSQNSRSVRLDHQMLSFKELDTKDDVELVLETDWTNSRDIVDHVEEDWLRMQSTVGLVGHPNVCAKPGNRAFLENAYEFLDRDGEWYLDRTTGTLYCCLADDADPNAMSFVAPLSNQLLRVAGTREQPVLNLHFKNLEFAYTDWQLPVEGYAGVQACYFGAGYYSNDEGRQWPGYMLPNAVQFEFARNCAMDRCAVHSVAGSGICLAWGCLDNQIRGCEVTDTSAHGVHIGWIDETPKCGWHYWWSPRNANRQPWHVNQRNTVTNSYIHNTSQEFWEGVGLVDMFSQATHIAHNEIAHTGSAGMVIGFCWEPNVITPESNTLVENNDVHHFCEKLGDSGGIYTLGRNPGAVMRANFIHDNTRRPAWLESPAYGIYLDQASEGWLLENNVLYLSQSPGFARPWNEPINIHTLLPDKQSNTARNNYIHAHDTGLFCYFDTPAGNLSNESNIPLSYSTDLERPEVQKIIRQAGPEAEYRSWLTQTRRCR